jgi:predicted tellurium resistance membrane protein TerC
VAASASIWQAVKIVCVADAVMSLDNVIAVAAAAKGDVLLLALGIAISIPPVVLGSTVMLYILDRFPILVIAGSGLLGYVAGELAIEDKFVHQWFEDHHITIPAMLPYLTCALVVLIGLYLRRKAARQQVEKA